MISDNSAPFPLVPTQPTLVKRITRTLPDGTVEVEETFQQAQQTLNPPPNPYWNIPSYYDHYPGYKVWCSSDKVEPGNQSGV